MAEPLLARIEALVDDERITAWNVRLSASDAHALHRALILGEGVNAR